MVRKLTALFTVCLLIAFYIPYARNHRLKSMEAEVYGILRAIRNRELSHRVEHDEYVSCPKNPVQWKAGRGAKEPMSWDADTEFDEIGFAPEGQVRHQYSVTVSENGKSFSITATGDLDEDGKVAIYTVTSYSSAMVKTGDNF